MVLAKLVHVRGAKCKVWGGALEAARRGESISIRLVWAVGEPQSGNYRARNTTNWVWLIGTGAKINVGTELWRPGECCDLAEARGTNYSTTVEIVHRGYRTGHDLGGRRGTNALDGLGSNFQNRGSGMFSKPQIRLLVKCCGVLAKQRTNTFCDNDAVVVETGVPS
ncbi:hypothetical protein J6590_043255 [Homalodisca vitripennis]|nr:hypothetical protein J6590_043255 [Homalodisca vitripennis]